MWGDSNYIYLANFGDGLRAYTFDGTIPSTCGLADSNTDNQVSITEIMNYISNWKAGSVTISELMTGIGKWKNGC
ncbi:MAG: hypothetical protein ABIG69_07695 [Bacteroidota bacterium]